MAVSGQPIPTGDLAGGWHQIMAEDFTQPVPVGNFPGPYADRFGVYNSGWKDTTKKGTYRPEQVLSVENDCLRFHPHYNPTTGEYVVATVYPYIIQGSRSGQLYERHSLRFRVSIPAGKDASALQGFKFVPLMWPDSENWPHDGEIDFPEGNLDENIKGYLHLQDATAANDQLGIVNPLTPMYGSWHTATTIWQKDKCEFYLDSICLLTTTSRVPNTPMHWDIQQETNTWGKNPTNYSEAYIDVDWVTRYAKV